MTRAIYFKENEKPFELLNSKSSKRHITYLGAFDDSIYNYILEYPANIELWVSVSINNDVSAQLFAKFTQEIEQKQNINIK
jgi:hypothetical protein